MGLKSVLLIDFFMLSISIKSFTVDSLSRWFNNAWLYVRRRLVNHLLSIHSGSISFLDNHVIDSIDSWVFVVSQEWLHLNSHWVSDWYAVKDQQMKIDTRLERKIRCKSIKLKSNIVMIVAGETTSREVNVGVDPVLSNRGHDLIFISYWYHGNKLYRYIMWENYSIWHQMESCSWLKWKNLFDRRRLEFTENKQTCREDDIRVFQSESISIHSPFLK
jgi:hypothetical protein